MIWAWRYPFTHRQALSLAAAKLTQLRDQGDIVRWNPLKISIKARNPLFHRLHDDPRWQEFLEKYGISAEQLADVQFKVTLPK